MSEQVSNPIYYQPSFMSEIIHSMPHLSLGLKDVDNAFRIGSFEYLFSLFILGLIPIVIALCMLLVLGIHIQQERSTEHTLPPTSCYCLPQKVLKWCIIILVIVILIEIILHFAVITSLPLTDLPFTDSMNEFHKFQVKKVDELCKKLHMNKKDFNGDQVDWNMVDDILERYKQLVREVLDSATTVRKPQLAPRKMHLPFAQYVSFFEWVRFIIFMTIWVVALAVCIVKHRPEEGRGRTSAKCGLWGIIFCSVSAGVLLAILVGLADACQDPSGAVTQITTKDQQEPFLRYQYRRMCQAYRTAMTSNLREFKQSVRDLPRHVLHDIVVEKMVLQPEFNGFATDKMWPDREAIVLARGLFRNTYKYRYDTYKHRRLYAQNVLTYTEGFTKEMDGSSWNDRMYCFESDDEIEEFIAVREDARDLCKGDRVLTWILLQIFLFLIASWLFFYIVKIHVDRWGLKPKEERDTLPI